jgi:hypothetical protein
VKKAVKRLNLETVHVIHWFQNEKYKSGFTKSVAMNKFTNKHTNKSSFMKGGIKSNHKKNRKQERKKNSIK